MIELRGVTKSYGSSRGVTDIGFFVDRGTVLGLLGPNGAGKTTVIKLLTGYHFADAGQVSVMGMDPAVDPVGVKREIGYLPENAPVYTEMIVSEYLAFCAGVRLPRKEIAGAIARAAEACGIASVLHRPISELSKGYRQRVGLAQAILHDPPILILDEPTTGLDPNQIQEIRKLIRDLSKDKTIIFSSHILSEVEAISTRVLIMNEGRLAAEGSTSEIAASIGSGVTVRLRCRGEEAALRRAVAEAGADTFVRDSAASPHTSAATNSAATQSAGQSGSGAAALSGLVTFKPGREEDDVAAALSTALVGAGLVILEMSIERAGLESLFTKLTKSQGGSDE